MKSPDSTALRELLQAGDPAAGDPGLGDRERARMRAEIVDAARRHAAVVPWLAPAVATATVLVLTLGLSWLLRPRVDLAPAAPRGVTAAESGAGGGGGDRQIQFTTPGGTLVVWVLTPAPELLP